MADPRTNLRVIRPSRRPLRPGDVFRVLLPDELYRFGRVIRTDARWTCAEGAGPVNLLYIYRYASSTDDMPPRSELRPDKLLIPPVLTNRLGWSRGYFDTVDNIPLDDDDVLSVHCFKSSVYRDTQFFDEMSNALPGPTEPVGTHGLGSYATIDDSISDAVGIPRAPL